MSENKIIHWEKSLDVALTKAKEEDKFVLLNFIDPK